MQVDSVELKLKELGTDPRRGLTAEQVRRNRDRYGSNLPDMQHCAHVFEGTQEKATLTVGADLNSQGVRRVKFKNLSLVPGQNQGFEIEVVK